jgi:hypothetical protein
MVGLDTSHCVAFTAILNDEAHEYHIPGAQVVAAYPGGSELFSKSRDRVQRYTEELRDRHGIQMVKNIRKLAESMDAILLESVDGRQHLEQFRQLAIGKPVYIDKPLTTSTVEARALIQVARDTSTPIMSGSSLRYAAGIADLIGTEGQGVSCEAFGRASLLEDYPGLFWYGIHSAEMLFAHMGTGCSAVRNISYDDMDVIVGEWPDGRLGIVRGTRFGKGTFGCVVHTGAGAKCAIAQSTPPYYYLLLQEVAEFFRTGVSPIDTQETLDIIAFLEAADLSRTRGGQIVETSSL